ncbi:MAG: hypothetical protein AAFR35_00730 [Pseudomonadota bacterium]
MSEFAFPAPRTGRIAVETLKALGWEGPIAHNSDIEIAREAKKRPIQDIGAKLGIIDYANEQQSYLGTYNTPSNNSPDTQEKIAAEVRTIVDEGYETAKQILTERYNDLHRLAEGPLDYETLTGDEITYVIAGNPLNRATTKTTRQVWAMRRP